MSTNISRSSRTLIAVAVSSLLIAGCASTPKTPDGVVQVRSKLMQLQAAPDLAVRAPVAIKDAEAAVSAAEKVKGDAPLTKHLVFIADRKVDTARALAEAAQAEDQRTALNEQREKARLDARTHEADVAKADAAMARADSAEQKLSADRARTDADTARAAAAAAQFESAELQRQIEGMNAQVTDRGVVLTLGDVLFSTGKADLNVAAAGNLGRLSTFLAKYPTRTAVVEGYTDSMGSDELNRDLSQRRAEGVKAYLVGQGVAGERISAMGKGESAPVADNGTADGRRQNRRVEVVISNAVAVSRSGPQ